MQGTGCGLRLSSEDIDALIGAPDSMDRDAEGRPRSAGTICGVTIVVVVAADEPDLVVTVFDRRR
jgi:hypothetical protein